MSTAQVEFGFDLSSQERRAGSVLPVNFLSTSGFCLQVGILGRRCLVSHTLHTWGLLSLYKKLGEDQLA